jgi:broad specificity phosphatase PhoE
MPSRAYALTAIVIALLFPVSAFAQTKGFPDPRHELKGEALIHALKGGGYTLLFRHTARQSDKMEFTDKIVMADCSTQSPLAELGKTQARSVGDAMRKLGIPLGETIASPFCRTMDTARLIAGNVRADKLVLGHKTDNLNEPTDFTRLIEILATPPEPGTNRVIVGHNNAFTDTEGGPYLNEGESAIFKAIDGKRVMVARLRVEDWQAYASPANTLPPSERSSTPDRLLQHHGMQLIGTIWFNGYTLYIRHAATNPAQQDKPPAGTADCSAQRNLSEAGREQARAIGTAFATMRFRISEVFAGSDCRSQETARLVTDRTDAIRTLAGAGGKPDDPTLEKLLSTPAPRSGLRIVVGDADAFNAVAGPPMLEEGEAVVLRTTDAGGWVILARVPAAEWARLAAATGFAPPNK